MLQLLPVKSLAILIPTSALHHMPQARTDTGETFLSVW
jgi:hypothetical protein